VATTLRRGERGLQPASATFCCGVSSGRNSPRRTAPRARLLRVGHVHLGQHSRSLFTSHGEAAPPYAQPRRACWRSHGRPNSRWCARLAQREEQRTSPMSTDRPSPNAVTPAGSSAAVPSAASAGRCRWSWPCRRIADRRADRPPTSPRRAASSRRERANPPIRRWPASPGHVAVPLVGIEGHMEPSVDRLGGDRSIARTSRGRSLQPFDLDHASIFPDA